MDPKIEYNSNSVSGLSQIRLPTKKKTLQKLVSGIKLVYDFEKTVLLWLSYKGNLFLFGCFNTCMMW